MSGEGVRSVETTQRLPGQPASQTCQEEVWNLPALAMTCMKVNELWDRTGPALLRGIGISNPARPVNSESAGGPAQLASWILVDFFSAAGLRIRSGGVEFPLDVRRCGDGSGFPTRRFSILSPDGYSSVVSSQNFCLSLLGSRVWWMTKSLEWGGKGMHIVTSQIFTPINSCLP